MYPPSSTQISCKSDYPAYFLFQLLTTSQKTEQFLLQFIVFTSCENSKCKLAGNFELQAAGKEHLNFRTRYNLAEFDLLHPLKVSNPGRRSECLNSISSFYNK